MTDRYDAAALTDFATTLLARAGLEPDKAATVAGMLVEGDLLGHGTHGLALLGPYVDEVVAGRTAGSGLPDVLAGTGVVETWDGRRLPGPWLVVRASDAASDRAREHGLAAVAIRRSAHIGCLAAYLRRITERGQMIIVSCTDPSTGSVAPFGGITPLYTPNPLAAGWPTPDGPVMIDVSMSITTNGMVGRLRREGRSFDHPVLLDNQGRPSADPNVAFTDPPGSLLPLGGVESGHKGFALGLLLEALTSALAGHGRADAPTEWGASILVLVIDPARFGGLPAFTRETGWIAEAARAATPVPGGGPVRVPGERGLALRAEQLALGVALHPSIPPALVARAEQAGIAPPRPIG